MEPTVSTTERIPTATSDPSPQERLRLVIVGHVDHGKSTVIGRLLADTGSLPEGKLEQVRLNCLKNAKPFEYAFLLDALHDEQDQGITIESARCFFRTSRRYYIVVDAPGHIEFLKNMVTGAANAEAALIVIDAEEGVKENTRRHGYLISMLGVRQVVVAVNKMDLADYRQEAFERIRDEYTLFLNDLKIEPLNFIPISARQGENMVERSEKMPWYTGPSVIHQLDALDKGMGADKSALPFRFPVQDIYKFTESGDDRRILAGTIETGGVSVGDNVLLYPSGKGARITSIEQFNVPPQTRAIADQAVGFTIDPQIYLKPGELMVKATELRPHVGVRFRASLFWMGQAPLIKDKQYKMKIATKSVGVRLMEVLNVIDASDLESVHNKQQVDRHDVGECIFETVRPIAFDLASDIDQTGRFVLVDQYEIAGGGIIVEALRDIDRQATISGPVSDIKWDRGALSRADRAAVHHHKALAVVLCGEGETLKRELARRTEEQLVRGGIHAYYLSFPEASEINERTRTSGEGDDLARRLGEIARVLTDSGQVFITVLNSVDDYDLLQFKQAVEPVHTLVITIGQNPFLNCPVDLHLDDDTVVDSAIVQMEELIRRVV